MIFLRACVSTLSRHCLARGGRGEPVGHVYTYVPRGMGTDRHMCIGVCIDGCVDMRVGTGDICVDLCVDMCADMCVDMCLCVRGHVS